MKIKKRAWRKDINIRKYTHAHRSLTLCSECIPLSWFHVNVFSEHSLHSVHSIQMHSLWHCTTDWNLSTCTCTFNGHYLNVQPAFRWFFLNTVTRKPAFHRSEHVLWAASFPWIPDECILLQTCICFIPFECIVCNHFILFGCIVSSCIPFECIVCIQHAPSNHSQVIVAGESSAHSTTYMIRDLENTRIGV